MAIKKVDKNNGDVAEGILAAAATARFISKTRDITFNDVKNVIKSLGRPKPMGNFLIIEKEFDSPNANPKYVDKVICRITLAKINMTALLNQKIYTTSYPDIIEIVNGAVAYCNKSTMKEWADMTYNNNQKNKIEINSTGLIDQKGTKVDVRILIDGKQKGVGISLKAGDVKQFGQVGGATPNAMNEYFTPFGVKFTKNKLDEFEDMVAEKKVTEAFCMIYSEAADQMKKIIKKDSKSFIKNLSDFMLYHATRNEPNVALLKLGKDKALFYDFNLLHKKLTGIKLDVLYEESTTKVIKGKNIPSIKIFAPDIEKDNVLLKLRNKLEGNRISSKTGKQVGLTIRNLVESDHLTTSLISETYK